MCYSSEREWAAFGMSAILRTTSIRSSINHVERIGQEVETFDARVTALLLK